MTRHLFYLGSHTALDRQKMAANSCDIGSSGQAGLNCLEVWGGHGLGNSQISRPGIEVSVTSISSTSSLEDGGGEIHLMSSCASGRITRFLMADISSIGSQYHSLATKMRDLLRKNVNSILQTRCERELTRRLQEAAEHGTSASTLVATYFSPRRTLTICNAGHPRPLHYCSKLKRWGLVEGTSRDTSNGGLDGLIDVSQHRDSHLKLRKGDLILFYSNALSECLSKEGITLGDRGLLDCVQELSPSDPRQISSLLFERLLSDGNSNLATSEATILLCQVTSTPVKLIDNLLAPFRVFRTAGDRTKLS